MDDIRTRLCANEDSLSALCKKHGIKYSAGNKKNYFKDLTHDGDLLNYVTTSMAASDMKVFTETIHGYGYKTCMDIISDYLGSMNVNDYLNIDSIKQNDILSTYQIAALVQNTTSSSECTM